MGNLTSSVWGKARQRIRDHIQIAGHLLSYIYLEPPELSRLQDAPYDEKKQREGSLFNRYPWTRGHKAMWDIHQSTPFTTAEILCTSTSRASCLPLLPHPSFRTATNKICAPEHSFKIVNKLIKCVRVCAGWWASHTSSIGLRYHKRKSGV